MIILKRGAMFGLDARIALAIFGSLSIISGAALYNTIENVRVVSIVTEILEVNKAIESYTLDTSSDLPLKFNRVYDLEALLTSSVRGWKGPYLQIEDTTVGDNNIPSNLDYGEYRLRRWHWPDAESAPADCSSSTNQCLIYIEVNTMDLVLAKKIDAHIDGSYTPSSGKMRVMESSAEVGHIYYRAHTPLFRL